MTWPLERRTPLRPMSKKRKAENRKRRQNVEAAFGTRPACGACLPLMLIGVDRARTGCGGWADDAHEMLSRGRGGSITDSANIVAVSRSCHRFIDDHDDLAQAAGLSRPSEDHLRAPRPLP